MKSYQIKMANIKSGNLNIEVSKNPENRGWFLGNFIKKDYFFNNNDFEIKWAVHKKGHFEEGHFAKSTAKTLVVLIKGKILTEFHNPEKKSITLSKCGDFLCYDAHEIHHNTKILEDSIVLAIRWPSKR